jgi:hypothetical protein
VVISGHRVITIQQRASLLVILAWLAWLAWLAGSPACTSGWLCVIVLMRASTRAGTGAHDHPAPGDQRDHAIP